MHVGLNRNRKRKGLELPPWLEEYGGWIAVAIVVFAFIVPIQMLGLFDRPKETKSTAAIRVASVPVKSWAEGSSTRIESISVDIENLGPESAREVAVQGVVRGSAFSLAGPVTIEPGKRERFVGMPSLNIMSEDQVTLRLSCANCPPAQ